MTPVGRSAREQAFYEALLYPGTEVLINKAGIRAAEDLEIFERDAVRARVKEGLPSAARKLTYDGFKAIHRHLFQDVYDWAGQERQYTTGRGPAPFAAPEYIAPWMDAQFKALAEEKHLRGLTPKAFAARAAEYVNEINAAHPFIEGNGRTMRTWLRELADQAGHALAFQSSDREAWNEASRIGFEESDHGPMQRLLEKRVLSREQARRIAADRDNGVEWD